MSLSGSVQSLPDATEQKAPVPVFRQMTGIILAGGKSTRMGRHKAFLPYGGSTMVENIFCIFERVFSETLIVTDSPDYFVHLTNNVVRDILPERGPVCGILSGLLTARFERCFVAPCHLPFVDEELIIGMIRTTVTKNPPVVYSRDEHKEPLLGIYSKELIANLEQQIENNQKLDKADLLMPGRYEQYEWDGRVNNPFGLAPDFSVNTPSDYSRVLAGNC